MKRLFKFIFIFLLIIPISVYASDTEIPYDNITSEQSEGKDVINDDLIPNAKSGILMDTTTGKILYEKNCHDKVAVASLTKMVAQILILESIEKGTISWDEKITISANASGMGGSQIWLETGEIMTVEDLMKGISMGSANDATVIKKQSLKLKEEITI